ncbi:MAG: HNH endonuclease [Xanthobacteraceae bacterium]|nr:HNH endonuclease [Xanthobacteraceae bacterium]MBX3534189.1 HNH endonuclease [Xanthobacteraceae bacterium]
MGYGLFVHRTDSIYDDSPAEKYQFPKQYLSRIEKFVGDWVIYYEPTKVSEARGYYAVAKVQRVIPDPAAPQMYLALIEPSTFLEFSNPVPFRDESGPVELGVLNEEGKVSGRAQSAVRPLSESDFKRIVERGLEEQSQLLPRLGANQGFDDQQTPFIYDLERERTTFQVSRVIRDRVFREVVLRAYDQRCAMSGLRFINGGGRAEVAAAHIRPVEKGGPDIINNGIALSGTAHWMFDRGLISLADNLEILISRQTNDLDGVRTFINKSGRALAPLNPLHRPHPHFLEWHRSNCFKQ